MTIKNVYHTRAIAVNEVIEFKKDLMVWAQNQETGYRTQARIAERKTVKANFDAKADSFKFMVSYLESLEIQ